MFSSSLVAQELTPEDVSDMCELAQHYALASPQSLRDEYSKELFWSKRKPGHHEGRLAPGVDGARPTCAPLTWFVHAISPYFFFHFFICF